MGSLHPFPGSQLTHAQRDQLLALQAAGALDAATAIPAVDARWGKTKCNPTVLGATMTKGLSGLRPGRAADKGASSWTHYWLTAAGVAELLRIETAIASKGNAMPKDTAAPSAEDVAIAAPTDAKPAHAPLMLRYADLVPDPDNARKHFDDAELDGLAETLFHKGMKQPPRALPADAQGKHQLFMGERRWRAWGRLIEQGRWTHDHTELVLIEDADDLARLEAGLIENLQRVNLNHMEAGAQFELLATRHKRNNKQIAEAIGRTPEFVQQHRRLTKLDEDRQAKVARGELPFQDALKILAKPKSKATPAQQLVLAEVALAVMTRSGGHLPYHKELWVDRPCGDDPNLAPWLEKSQFLQFNAREYRSQLPVLNWSYSAAYHLKEELPIFAQEGADLDAFIDELRTEVYGETHAIACRQGKRFATDWLNQGAELDADGKAELDRRAEAETRRKREEAEAKAKRDAVAKDAKALGHRVKKGEAGPADIQKAFEDLGVKLPLRQQGEEIQDADGRKVCELGWGYSSTGLDREVKAQAIRLIVLAANAGLQFAKSGGAKADEPEAAPAGDDEEPIPESLQRLATGKATKIPAPEAAEA